MKMPRRLLRSPTSPFALALLASLSLLACKGEEAAPEQPAAEASSGTPVALKGTRVEVAVVEPSFGGMTIRVPGEVEGIRDALLAAPMGGYIEQVSVKEGQHVKKGAVLARVDSSTYSTRLVRAQVEAKAAEREFKRTESLGSAVPAAELDSAQDRVATAKAALRELQVAASRSVMTAPFSGVVVSVDAEVGEVASPGSPLFRLVQLQPVRVSIALADRDVAITKKGMKAQVEAGARSGVYEGEVVQISQAANLKTRSFEALVEVENQDESLLPGMIAQVTLSTENLGKEEKGAKRLLISQDWLVTKPNGVGLFVAQGGKAVWKDVKLGNVVRRQVEVLDGLQSGDALIIVGHRTLADGDPILIHRKGTCCTDGRAVFTE